MRRVVEEQRLSFVATVNPDGTPNLSPKGSIRVWDTQHLVFGDIRSPDTVRNLEQNPAVEINVVDPIARKGYRFRGTVEILRAGARYDRLLAFLEQSGVSSAVGAVVLVRVEKASPVVSPAYDSGASEAEIRARWGRARS
jgi:predicted pyridoxine 5'-phosphate oxidase superfamily flavin-nucleotide-binding protein